MGSQPLVSVCIPSYNGESFIGRTLESVLAQSLPDFELIIVDDASTDATVSIINAFGDPRIQLYENDKNLGMAGNWDRALSKARGKYVKLLCGDDILYPDCLARQAMALEAPDHAEVALAVCNRNVINSRNEVVLRRKFPFRAGRISGRTLIRDSVRWGSNLIGEPAVGLFRRELLKGKPPFEASNPYLLDLSLWAGLLRQGDAFLDPDYLAGFRISSNAASTTIGRRQAAQFRSFVRAIQKDTVY